MFLNPMGLIDTWAAREAEYAAKVAQAMGKSSPAISNTNEKKDTLRPLTPSTVLYNQLTYIFTNIFTDIYIHIDIHTYIYVHINKYIFINTYTYIHTYIHTTRVELT